MEHKKDLAKIAMAAFLLASTTPVNGHVVENQIEMSGTFLAAGCGENCGSKASSRSNVADPRVDRNGYYNANYDAQHDNFNSNNADKQRVNQNYQAAGQTSSGTLTEAQLLGSLSPQSRAIYLSLDPEGKALAIQLANQDPQKDKNLAVQEAQRRMIGRMSGPAHR